MTNDEQLREWANGNSLHRGDRKSPRSECTPDFSCCKPELSQPLAVRRAYVAGDERTRNKFHGSFLAAAIAKMAPRKKVHITGSDPQ